MDHKQATKTMNPQDPEWAARVVRDIAQVEADFFHAAGAVSERMMKEAAQAIRKIAGAPWHVSEAGLAVQIVHTDWKMIRGVGVGDMWLELSEIGAVDGDDEHCWLAAAVRSGPTQLGIEIRFRPGLQEQADNIIQDDTAMAPIWKLGFAREETDLVLFMPIAIDSAALELGFRKNDLTAALAPVGTAFAKAISAKLELDKLLDRIRRPAARK